ncbi:MAG: hypothetical protein HQL38_18530 [Alphaproteobacteria bacterium]|nr:hypothetical protein [Alphaproteobacteria bacterium]MBF0394677.1 hypothetical protein [Alphaproteobacteria bacterium]
MIDLASLDTAACANRGAAMTLLHPATRQPLLDSEGQAVAITLAGQDSEAWRKAQRIVSNRRLAARGKAKLTAEELEVEALEMLARCTLAWTGVVIDGKALDCTPANARHLYERLPWVREQADDFVADRANYLGN